METSRSLLLSLLPRAGVVLTALAVTVAGCQPAESSDAPAGSDLPEAEQPAASEQPADEPAASEQPADRPATPAEEPAAVIPSGTEIAFRTQEAVSSDSHAPGDVFSATVADDVQASDGSIAIPAGTLAHWEVTQAGEDEEGNTVLAFRLQGVEISGGFVPVTSTVTSTELNVDQKDSNTETAAKVAVGTAAGALVGQILGKDTESTLKGAAAGTAMGAVVALTTRGGSARMDAGSLITVRTEETLPAS